MITQEENVIPNVAKKETTNFITGLPEFGISTTRSGPARNEDLGITSSFKRLPTR